MRPTLAAQAARPSRAGAARARAWAPAARRRWPRRRPRRSARRSSRTCTRPPGRWRARRAACERLGLGVLEARARAASRARAMNSERSWTREELAADAGRSPAAPARRERADRDQRHREAVAQRPADRPACSVRCARSNHAVEALERGARRSPCVAAPRSPGSAQTADSIGSSENDTNSDTSTEHAIVSANGANHCCGDAAHERDRHEHDDDREGRRGDRQADLGGALARGA